MSELNFVKPGNYFITKSMHWNVKEGEGEDNSKIKLEQYWYFKKFITLYFYIFSSKSGLEYDETYKKISINFDRYIESMPRSIQPRAHEFFYSRNIKSFDKVIRWDDFVKNDIHFKDKKQEAIYIMLAKKVYFMYLMNIGGQSGIKKYILKDLVNNGVPFEKIGEEIFKHEEFGRKVNIDPASFARGKSTILENKQLRSEVNDATAPLRNYRQLFCIYGFFYESVFSNLGENFSLTTVGKNIIEANFLETALIIEHQKIKMISQPPTIDIQNIAYDDNFFIELNPYQKILKYIEKNTSINYQEYMYKVSRNTSTNVELDSLKTHIELFDRVRDNKTEDFNKELEKYLGGLFSELLPELQIIEEKKSRGKIDFIIKDEERLTEYIDLLQGVKNKKKGKFKNRIQLYKDILLKKHDRNFKSLEDWYSYVSGFDNYILIRLTLYVSNYGKIKYSKLKEKLPLLINIINSEIDTNTFKAYLDHYQSNYKDIDTIIRIEEFEYAEDPLYTLTISSTQELINISNEKYSFSKNQRAHISYIKKYYLNKKVSRCDCCNAETFRKENGEWYLEYHHLVPLSKQGLDHVYNLFGVCANCHRQFHFGRSKDKLNMYSSVNDRNALNIDLKERYKELMVIENQVFMLDYLFSEGALTKADYDEIKLNAI